MKKHAFFLILLSKLCTLLKDLSKKIQREYYVLNWTDLTYEEKEEIGTRFKKLKNVVELYQNNPLAEDIIVGVCWRCN